MSSTDSDEERERKEYARLWAKYYHLSSEGSNESEDDLRDEVLDSDSDEDDHYLTQIRQKRENTEPVIPILDVLEQEQNKRQRVN
jgi:hypothetical protein